jgi:sigma-E factor negative regulatory protein RseB
MRWLSGSSTALALLVLLAAAPPAAAAEPAGKPLPAGEARQWLQRIHGAAYERNYQGTLVFSAGGGLSSSRVAHFSDGGHSYERVEVLDGRRQQTFRHNDRVVTLWPRSRVVVIEEREPRQASLRQVVEPRAEEVYEVHDQGSEHVAGRETRVLLLQPRDEHRFAQRLWIDRRSALVLRAELLGLRQEVLESSAFSEVEIGVKSRPQTVLQPMRQLDGWRQVRPTHVATPLENEGWTLKALPAGFRLEGCTKRTLDPAAAAAAPVLQAVFSDGLTHVSLFVEAIDRDRRPSLTQVGATHTLMQPHGSQWWVTVMGDVPPATLKLFHQALERRR